MKSKHTDWNIHVNISFIIHVDFDHVWAEHYPVTLINNIRFTVHNLIKAKCILNKLNAPTYEICVQCSLQKCSNIVF